MFFKYWSSYDQTRLHFYFHTTLNMLLIIYFHVNSLTFSLRFLLWKISDRIFSYFFLLNFQETLYYPISAAVITRQKKTRRHVHRWNEASWLCCFSWPTRLLMSRRTKNWCGRPLNGEKLQLVNWPCGIGDKQLKATKLDWCGLQYLPPSSKETTIMAFIVELGICCQYWRLHTGQWL